LRFSLNPKELNEWKARITERLVECYVEQNLIPRLKREEDWDIVIFSRVTWFSVPGSLGFNPDFKDEKLFFLANRLLPKYELLNNFKELTKTLSNCPDGFLIKLRKTGGSKTLKDGMAEMGLKSERSSIFQSTASHVEFLQGRYLDTLKEHGYAIEKSLSFDSEKHEENEQLPIVDGEIEIVEVKSGKGNLARNQIQSYTEVVKKGFTLRFFLVNIVSFERNEFEIKEKSIRDPNEIKTRIDVG